jgi:uncharacterized GH25 family protein
MRRLLLAGVIVGLLCATVLPQQNGRKSATLSFVVVKDGNGKPVRNAEIVLHPLDKTGKQKQEGLELKTHEDGKAEVNGIPYGTLRIQVIAHGFRTYGQDYDINQPVHEITIKMQKPSEQYSIYK